MKYIFLIAFILPGIWVSAQSSALQDAEFDVQHYKFEVQLNDASDNIKGRATISLLTRKETRRLELDLVKAGAGGKGMRVDQVILNGQRADFSHMLSKIFIEIPRSVNAGKNLELIVVYQGIPGDGLIISKNKFGERTFFADNWPNRAHNWLPCNDSPADKASVEFLITAPTHYQVVANGMMIERTDLKNGNTVTHYREDVPLPTKVMVIGLARFSVQHIGETNCIPITSWVYAENREMGQAAYKPAKEALEFFIENVGPYPYKKLANVQSKTIFGGLENASAIFYFENSVTGIDQNEALVVHEVAHQWFGNHATETNFSHLWLSEGFASYFTHLYIEKKYGADSLRRRMITDREAILRYYASGKRKPVVDNTSDYMELLNPNSYQKGSWILHMLRNTVGDSLFWTGIREYYAMYAGKNASSEDFRKVMEKVSGRNLASFFHQWLEQPGQPEISLRWSYENGRLLASIEQRQAERFEFPLEIGILTREGMLIKSVRVSSGKTDFSLPLSEKPLSVEPDPNARLLFRNSVTGGIQAR